MSLKQDGYDFAEVVKTTTEDAMKQFEQGAREVELSETGWGSEEVREQLKEDCKSVADLLRVEETKKMVTVIEVSSRASRSRLDAVLTTSSTTEEHQEAGRRDGGAELEQAKQGYVGQDPPRIQNCSRQGRRGLHPQGDQ